MKTRVIQEQITRDKTIYIAEDGMEFEEYSECQKYEETLAHKKKMLKLKEIEHNKAMMDESPLDGGDYPTDHDYRWFKPKTAEEVHFLNEAFGIMYGKILLGDVEKWICVEKYDIEDETDDAYVARLEDSIKHIKDFLNGFGYDVTITERE